MEGFLEPIYRGLACLDLMFSVGTAHIYSLCSKSQLSPSQVAIWANHSLANVEILGPRIGASLREKSLSSTKGSP